MQTIFCELHRNVIFVFDPAEEGMFIPRIEATAIFRDERGKTYLKKFSQGRCDDSCPTVITVCDALQNPAEKSFQTRIDDLSAQIAETQIQYAQSLESLQSKLAEAQKEIERLKAEPAKEILIAEGV